MFDLHRDLYRNILSHQPDCTGKAKISADNEPTARSATAGLALPGATIGDLRCLQPFQLSSGLRPRRDPAHIFGFSTPVARASRTISPVAPPSQPFASSTTARCG